MTRQGNYFTRATHPTIAKWCIWSVENQSWLAGQMTIYIWSATAAVAIFALGDVITLGAAIWALFVSGVIVCISIWLLVLQRRTWLLNIEDPELRQQALDAMLNYLSRINYRIPLRPHSRPRSDKDPKERADCSHPR